MKIDSKSFPRNKDRLTASISEQVMSDLYLYIDILEEKENCKLTLSFIVENMLKTFMKDDKNFQKLKAQRS